MQTLGTLNGLKGWKSNLYFWVCRFNKNSWKLNQYKIIYNYNSIVKYSLIYVFLGEHVLTTWSFRYSSSAMRFFSRFYFSMEVLLCMFSYLIGVEGFIKFSSDCFGLWTYIKVRYFLYKSWCCIIIQSLMHFTCWSTKWLICYQLSQISR